MFKKTIAAAGCLAVVAAGVSYAASTWQLQTKLNTVGGKLQVRDKAWQTAAGVVAYNNFTTSASIPVTIQANPGYKITLVKKGTASLPIANDQLVTTSLDKTGGTLQTVQASFTANQYTINGAAVGAGSVTPASQTVSYNGTVVFTATPANGATSLTAVSAGTVTDAVYGTPVTLPYNKPVKITVSNIQAASTMTATYASYTVSAGADKVVGLGAAVKIYGSVTAGDPISWTMVSGPVAVDTTSWTTATPSFTPTVAGTYVFKATEAIAGQSDTVEIVATADLVAYMGSACNGCHNPTTGNTPSTAFDKWSASPHVAAQVSCISCHTDGAMPTPVNTQTVDPATLKVLNASAGTVDAYYCSKCHGHIAIKEATNSYDTHQNANKNDCSVCHTFENHSLVRTAVADTVTAKHVSGKAVPATGANNVGDSITEYVTNGATCADCHNSTNSVIAAFAAGGHGHISDDPLNAFGHYDWSGRLNNGTRQNGNCNRCHSAGGFVKFTGQDAALATRLAPQAGQPSGVLVCVSCHSNIDTGALRTNATPAGNPTTLAGGYFALFSSSAAAVTAGNTKIQVAFPGYKNSSICIPCHSGRTTDKVITATIQKSFDGLKNYTTISTGFYQHAFNMGQTFIGKGAYDFGGLAAVAKNGHEAVANGAADTQGPCVGCHHSSTQPHSLHVTGFTAACSSCHGNTFGAADVEAAKAKFDAGVKVLTSLIEAKFNPLRTVQTSPISTERANVRFGRFGKAAGVAADAETAKKAYGAWYNWHILTNADPGAFVHNPSYARAILFDTIDYLDGDGAALNGSAEATIAASTVLSDTEKAEAAEFFEPACNSCHSTQVAKIETGKHAAEFNTHNGSCGRCHSTEGYLAFTALVDGGTKEYTGSYTGDTYNGNTTPSCAACHDTHGQVRATGSNWTPKYADNNALPTKEFKLCTSCHNLVNEAGLVTASGNLVSGTQTVAKQQHSKDWYRNIASTHYDLTTTGVGQSSTVIEGYNVRFNKESACTDCHGHEMYTNTGGVIAVTPTAGTIHTDWAQSGHAGGLLKAKFGAFTTANPTRSRNVTNAAAVMAAGVTGTSGPAWEHYNWDDSTGTASDRKSCQKCHTATGVSNFLDAVAAKNTAGDQSAAVAYNAANNDFSHLAQWATAKVSPQNEMLYCWGCHKSAETGELRVTGNMTLDYKATTADTANIVINAPSNSAACVSCHAGRGNAASLFGAATIDPAALLDGTTTPKNSATATATHYLNAAATINQAQTKVGYEYPGKNYANPVYFKHNTVGCNECHMPAKSHKFDVATKDKNGVITAINATNCGSCHSGAYAMTAAKLEEEAEGYKQALAAFNDTLISKGYTWSPNYPYFLFTGAESAKKWRTQGDLGAGHNYNYLLHEPGAYAHNRYYAKRLIFDSIDWLDNNVMDGSISIDAVKYPEAAIWLGATRP